MKTMPLHIASRAWTAPMAAALALGTVAARAELEVSGSVRISATADFYAPLSARRRNPLENLRHQGEPTMRREESTMARTMNTTATVMQTISLELRADPDPRLGGIEVCLASGNRRYLGLIRPGRSPGRASTTLPISCWHDGIPFFPQIRRGSRPET